MEIATQRQDVAGREGRLVRDMRARRARHITWTAGVGIAYAGQGYQNHAQAGSLNITIRQPAVYIAGVKVAITSWPADGIQTVTASDTRYNYLTVELDAETVTYHGDAAADPGNGDDNTEYYVLNEVTTDANRVTDILDRTCGDIHIERSSE